MICVLTPSRGLIHSRTVADVSKEMAGMDWCWLLSHGLPIPDCFNELVERALKTKSEYFLFIEDDMHLPEGIISEVFKSKASIVTVDYPVLKHHNTVKYLDGKFAYGGMGILLVKREVFGAMEKPYFRTDTSYQIQDDKLIATPAISQYGLQDVDFYQRTKQHPVEVISQTAGQYCLLKPELPKYNNQTALEYEVETWLL